MVRDMFRITRDVLTLSSRQPAPGQQAFAHVEFCEHGIAVQ